MATLDPVITPVRWLVEFEGKRYRVDYRDGYMKYTIKVRRTVPGPAEVILVIEEGTEKKALARLAEFVRSLTGEP